MLPFPILTPHSIQMPCIALHLLILHTVAVSARQCQLWALHTQRHAQVRHTFRLDGAEQTVGGSVWVPGGCRWPMISPPSHPLPGF